MDFLTKLNTSARERDSWLCVGLDPVVEHLPVGLPGRAAGVVEFCSRIVLATAPYACAFKPNIAFFEALGADAFAILKDVVDSVPDGIPVILDAKRGDIGSTAEMYARAYFDELGVDAVTVNPYMGWDAVRPFAERPNKAAFVLCLTSNQSAESVQMLPVEGEPLFLRIAEMVASWGISCGLVVGATRADMIAAVRARCREQVLLIPGIGAQGGDLKRSVELGAWQGGGGALINASRSLLYASGGEDFAEAAAAAAVELRADISRCQPST